MRRHLLASACLVPCLAACAPETATPAPVSAAAAVAEPARVAAAAPATAVTAASVPEPAAAAPTPRQGDASIAGAIRDGNRPPPALRICATPVDGGAPTCIDSAAGARDYRIEVAPGRYFLLGWVQGGELQLIAHAVQIRCIRAPCPPDELIEVEVAAGEHRDGIDLSGGYAEVPDGWPQRP